MSDELVTGMGRRTLQGVEAAEAMGSGCAWLLAVGVPVAAGAVATTVVPWAGAVGALLAVAGALLLRRLTRARAARANGVLTGFERVVLPSWGMPLRAPRGERTEDGVFRLWRLTWDGPPNGRAVVAEVAVHQETHHAWFVVWPVSRPRPRETRRHAMVLEPVVAGYLVSSPQPERTAELLRDPLVRELIFELLGEHDELAVYPYAAWWRTRAAAQRGALRRAEVRLAQLTQVLHAR